MQNIHILERAGNSHNCPLSPTPADGVGCSHQALPFCCLEPAMASTLWGIPDTQELGIAALVAVSRY